MSYYFLKIFLHKIKNGIIKTICKYGYLKYKRVEIVAQTAKNEFPIAERPINGWDVIEFFVQQITQQNVINTTTIQGIHGIKSLNNLNLRLIRKILILKLKKRKFI